MYRIEGVPYLTFTKRQLIQAGHTCQAVSMAEGKSFYLGTTYDIDTINRINYSNVP